MFEAYVQLKEKTAKLFVPKSLQCECKTMVVDRKGKELDCIEHCAWQ